MSKNILPSVHLIQDGDMSSDITSSAVNVQYLDNISIQLVFEGNAVGDFSVEASLDYREQQGYVSNPGNWVAIPLSPVPVAAGSDDDIAIDINQLSAPYIRVKYTATSGASTLNGYINGKAV